MTNKCEIDALWNKKWYNSNGGLHREDVPAIEWTDGDTFWYLNDQQYSHAEWLNIPMVWHF